MLPYIGSATRDTRDAMGFRALDSFDAFFAGKQPVSAWYNINLKTLD